jgi:cytochrome b6-f complex iron-sulfur subunit
MDQPADQERRSFLKKVALSSSMVAGVLASLGALRAIVPTLTRDKSVYKIGALADYPINSFTFSQQAECFIFRDHQGIRAVSAICTHLGCTLEKNDDGFNCPCHGSYFNQDGKVLSGPAPRSLAWFKVGLAADGQLVVDKKQRVVVDEKFLIS